MNILINYMREDIFGNIRFSTEEISGATVVQLRKAIQFFYGIKNNYTKMLINNDVHFIENTVMKINYSEIYFASVSDFNNYTVTIKTHYDRANYDISKMQFIDYLFRIERQIRERNITDDNIDTLFV